MDSCFLFCIDKLPGGKKRDIFMTEVSIFILKKGNL
jgi:hypothetical protein